MMDVERLDGLSIFTNLRQSIHTRYPHSILFSSYLICVYSHSILLSFYLICGYSHKFVVKKMAFALSFELEAQKPHPFTN